MYDLLFPFIISIIVKKERKLKELLTRVLVAAIGIPLAMLAIYTGGLVFYAVIAVIASIGLWEYYHMAHKNNLAPHKTIGIIAGLLLTAMFYVKAFSYHYFWLAGLFIIFILLIMIIEMFRVKTHPMSNIATTIAGVMYISLSFSCIIGIRQFHELQNVLAQTPNPLLSKAGVSIPALLSSEACGWLVLSIFISVWVCDSAAYFVGKSIGKHKLFPRVSPKKSWEGAVGGLFGAILGFWLSTHLLIPNLPIIYSIICGTIVGTIGQIGDLAESLLKREAGVKDSSNIIPGHGGVLDRFDSIMFAMPVIYIVLVLAVFLGI